MGGGAMRRLVSHGSGAAKSRQRFQEEIEIDRLGQDREAPRSLAGGGRTNDDRKAVEAMIVSDCSECFPAVHQWHQQIEDDNARLSLSSVEDIQRFATIRGYVHLKAFGLDHESQRLRGL